MATVEQSIDVDVPVLTLQEGWKRFAEWVLIGNYRLVCDALSCERMTDGETVSFTGLDRRHSRITVRFDFDDASSPDPAEKLRRITTRLIQDLAYFREYLKRDHRGRRHGPAERKDAAIRGDHEGHPRLTSDSFIEHDDDDTLGSPHYMA
jgi:hypothetical protein